MVPPSPHACQPRHKSVSRAAALILILQSTVQAQSLAVTSHQLANGMKVLIHEDRRTPQVALYLFYKVGSRNERPGITGISHFFEHMMFNGSAKYGPKQFDIEMEKNGGRNNAYTSRDLTVYTDWFPREALPLIMDMEADRMRALRLEPKMVESERDVVYSERHQSVDNSNFGMLYEQLNAAAYTAHPYGWPIIGWASDIKAWTIEDLEAHYKMGYAPNNCLMVVVGDVRAEEVLRLARERFEILPPQPPPARVRTIEPEQNGVRRVTVTRQAELPLLMASYPAPNASHADTPAMQVLGAILTEGHSSRLYRRMVDGDQRALSVSHFLEPLLDAGQLVFVVRPRAGIPAESAEKTLFDEIDRTRAGEPPEAELRKAKNQLLAALYRELRGIAGKASLLGQYEIYHGDHRKLAEAQSRIDGVTAAEVLAAARKYLAPGRRTIAILEPIAADKKP